MNIKNSAPVIEDVLSFGYRPLDDINVSEKSIFADDVWDFTDNENVRLNSVSKSKLILRWSDYESETVGAEQKSHRVAFLPKGILQEIKVLAYLNLKLPSGFQRRGLQSIKPQTVGVTVRALVRLFSEIYKFYLVDGLQSSHRKNHLLSISNITLMDLTRAISQSDRSDGIALKKGLKDLASPILKNMFTGGPLHWNKHDIDALDFTFTKKRTDYQPVMPNELFRLLSNTACSDVTTFLKFIGISTHDSIDQDTVKMPFNGIADGGSAIADYLVIREKDRLATARVGKKQAVTQVLREHFKFSHGITPKSFFEYLYRIQRASYTVIGLYTGARYGDLTTFTTDCIKQHHGQYVLAGTLVKNKPIDAKQSIDLWPAIPIMRDAIQCLIEVSKITFNSYLISGCESVPIGAKAAPLSLTGFTQALNTYLAEIDESKRWQEWRINAHQLRHTLANQLARADVGLIFIAHQLKHLHTALNALPPNVTMMYGHISELTQQRAMQTGPAYLEAAKALYSPDQPIAGGGAEQHKKRRKEYFAGMAAQGWTEDEVIANLAKQGLPFASVGIGYCGGKRETIRKDGTKELPPCLGAMQCNPQSCNQALITVVHKPQWQKIFEQNRAMAADPRMAYAKDVFTAAADNAMVVLAQLSPTPQ